MCEQSASRGRVLMRHHLRGDARLEALDASTTEARAAQLLHGLGFTKAMQAKRTRDFSGGWRMRIALARALFVDPTFLILDGGCSAQYLGS